MRISILILLILFSLPGLCQDSPHQLEDLRKLYKVLDTVKKDNTSVTLQIVWMDSLIEISKTVSLKYDLAYQRKFRRDSTFIPTASDTLQYNELRRVGSQNCHSYALEKYFEYHRINSNELFTNRTVVTENKFMENILVTTFKKVSAIPTKPKKNLTHSFTKGTILVFRNKGNTPIHSVFYDGKFHSKYGAWAPRAEKDLYPILAKYWDSTTIEEFQLDALKIEKYVGRGTD